MKNHSQQQGQILILAIVILAILIVLSSALLGSVALQLKSGRTVYNQAQALQVAEAGLDKALYELNLNSNFNGDALVTLTTGQFTTSVSTINSINKIITATGYVPDSTNPQAQVTVKSQVEVNSDTIAFNYGIQVGDGGMSMDNNSQVTGNVFSNGNVSGSGTITGDTSVAAGTAAIPDQECINKTVDYVFDNNVTANRDIAQKFSPATTGALNKIQVYIRRTGSPNNLTVRIMPHNSGTDQPSHTGQIGSSGSFSAIGTSYGWIDVSFSTAPTVTAGTTYWVVVDGSTNSSTVYYTVGADGSYACNGAGKYASVYSNNPPSWQPIVGSTGADLNIKTFIGGVTTTLSGVTVNGNARAQQMSGCTVGGNAYYENGSTSCSVTGTQYSGTAAPSPQALPISDAKILEWEDEADSGGILSSPCPYVINGSATLGPTKIACDLTLSNGATLYMTGPIWVEGDITTGNNSAIRMDNSLGNAGAVLIADKPTTPSTKGYINISNNTIVAGNNNPGSYPLLLSTKSSGTAISVSNNSTAAIYYASAGMIDVANNAAAKELTGYSIHLNNNAVITYDTGLQSATFANGPGGAWAFVPGTYLIAE